MTYNMLSFQSVHFFPDDCENLSAEFKAVHEYEVRCEKMYNDF
jgi:hypothetical protein